MKNILIVEDESLVALELKSTLESMGYKVIGVASDSTKALDIVSSNSVDVVLMDIYIKGSLDGIQTARLIKEMDKDIPIIYTSALSDEETIQRAIQTDPASYQIKPINPKELQVAITIATKKYVPKPFLNIDEVKIDDSFIFNKKTNELLHNGIFVKLTKKESELLSLLIRSKNSIVSFYEMENTLWPLKSPNENTRRALVSRLRAKLNHKFIKTVSSLGYMIEIT